MEVFIIDKLKKICNNVRPNFTIMQVKINESIFEGEYGLLSDHDGTLVYGGEEAHTKLVKRYFQILKIDPSLSEPGTSFVGLLRDQLPSQQQSSSIVDLFYEGRNLAFQKPSDDEIKVVLDRISQSINGGIDAELKKELRKATEEIIQSLRDSLKVRFFEDSSKFLNQPHFPNKSCIVTGCPADIMASNARFHGIDLSKSFKGAICADDKNGPQKPDPTPYIKGARLIGISPDKCVALEDSYSGLLAAVRAGCLSVFVNRGNKPISEKVEKLIGDSSVLTIQTLDQVRFSN